MDKQLNDKTNSRLVERCVCSLFFIMVLYEVGEKY